MKPILVTTYINPDLDGFASVVAYTEFLDKTGRSSQSFFSGQLLADAAFAASRFRLDCFDQPERPQDFEKVVVLDLSDLNRLDERIEPGRVIEVIDHRPVDDFSVFPNAEFCVESVGASATLVAERFRKNNVSLSEKTAWLLCCAIAVHNLNFKSPGFTRRDKDAFEWLKERSGFDLSLIQEVFSAKSDLGGNKLAQAMENDFKWLTIAGKRVGIAQLEVVSGQELVCRRANEILSQLAEMKSNLFLDFIFLSIVDVQEGVDYWVTNDDKTQALLKRVSGIEFSQEGVARTEKLILRKAIISLLKKELT